MEYTIIYTGYANRTLRSFYNTGINFYTIKKNGKKKLANCDDFYEYKNFNKNDLIIIPLAIHCEKKIYYETTYYDKYGEKIVDVIDKITKLKANKCAGLNKNNGGYFVFKGNCNFHAVNMLYNLDYCYGLPNKNEFLTNSFFNKSVNYIPTYSYSLNDEQETIEISQPIFYNIDFITGKQLKDCPLSIKQFNKLQKNGKYDYDCKHVNVNFDDYLFHYYEYNTESG